MTRRAERGGRHEGGEPLVCPLRKPGVSRFERDHQTGAVRRGPEPATPEERAEEQLDLHGIRRHAASDAARVAHGT